MPSKIHDHRRKKFEHTLQPTVFLGYVVQPGCAWYRKYRYVFLDDLAEMSFYRLVRWSQARVTVHSGREMYFDDKHAPVFPCRTQYEQDNETLKGIRAGKDFIDQDKATYGDSDDEDLALDEEDVDVDPNAAEGEETVAGPSFVEFEPFPQEVHDELIRLQKDEEETAQTFDYVPTSVDEQGHSVDQFGFRIQKTTRPPIRFAHRVDEDAPGR